MADKRTKRQPHPAVIPASSRTPRHSDRRPTPDAPCHSDRSPDIVGTKRRNLFQHLFSFPTNPYRSIYHTITASIAQNEPNFQNPRIAATHCKTRNYKKNTPCPTQKNKPNQTQFIPAKPRAKPDLSRRSFQRSRNKANSIDAVRNTHHPIREIDPIPSTQYAVRTTHNAIRKQTQSYHRFTLHACPLGEMRHPTYACPEGGLPRGGLPRGGSKNIDGSTHLMYWMDRICEVFQATSFSGGRP